MAEFSTERRSDLSRRGLAMPDGSFPIRNKSDLRNAISSYGRAKNPDAAKRWIIRRARALNALDMLPKSWNVAQHSDILAHYGVKGMKWGVRRYKNKDGSLTVEGKKHVSNFKKYQNLSKKADQESTRLIKSDKRLQRDFGVGTDDYDFLEYIARTQYGIDTTSFWNSVVNRENFYAENSNSIKIGRKIVAKHSSKKAKP